MIRLAFLINREVLNFAIQDKVIKYTDRKWGKWIQCVPKDPNFMMKIRMSRNRLPSFLINLFKLSDKEQEEYDAAKTDEELAEVIKKDALGKGCKLMVPKLEETEERINDKERKMNKDWREEIQ